MEIFRTSCLGGSSSRNLERTAPKRWREEPGYTEILQIRASLNIKRLSLIKEKQITQAEEFRAFLYVGRCKSLGSLKSFLWYAPQLLGANILCFIHILSFLRAHHREWLQWWLLDGWHSFLPEFPRSSPAHHPWWLQLLVTVTSLCVEIFYFSSLWEKLCCKLHRPRTNSQGL